MSFGINGTFSADKTEGEIVGSKPTRCMYNLSTQKKIFIRLGGFYFQSFRYLNLAFAPSFFHKWQVHVAKGTSSLTLQLNCDLDSCFYYRLLMYLLLWPYLEL
jgi:hypothetical protein